MSKNKFGIVASVVFALSIVLTPAASACSLQDLSSCDNNGLMALVLQLLAGQTTETPTSTTTISGIPAGFQFNTNLKLGSTGDDVKYLQILLNSDSATSVGNAGSETTYFGSMTQAAVVKFQNKYASEVLTPYGLTAGTGFFGTSSRAKANTLISSGVSTPVTTLPAGCTSTTGFSSTTGQSCSVSSSLPAGCTSTAGFSPTTGQSCSTGTVTPVTGSGLSAFVASDSPSGSTLVTGQAIAPLAKFVLTNGDSVAASITKVELQRLGVSADTTLSNVYLYQGDTRLTDAATISQGKVTFNNPNGVIIIPAGQSVIITVASDIYATGTSGQTVGVSLTGLTSTVNLNSTLPLQGGIQTIASATLATATVGSATPSTTSVNAGTTNYTVFSAPLTISQRAVSLKSLTLKQIGSIPTDALANIQLYVNGIAVGSPVSLASDGTARFVLATPYEISSGSSTLEVRADIVKGSSRNFSFSLQNASDLAVIDSVYNVNGSVAGTPKTTGIVSISEGSVSVTLDSTFNTTSITSGTSNATLAKYNFKAFGEDVKVSYLDVTPSTAMDNVVIYANGSPITSYQNYTSGTLHFSLGSSLVIPANTTTSVEVRADTKVNGVNISTSSISVTLTPYSNNAQGVSSSQLVTVPTINIAGPSLTIGTGSLALVKSSGVANGKITPNTDNQRIGSYVIQAGATEAVRVNNLTLLLTGTLSRASLSNLYIKYGTTQSTPITPQASNNFPVNIELAASQSMTVEVYANVGAVSATPNTDNTQVATASNITGAVAQVSTVTLNGDTETAGGNIVVTINGIPVTTVLPAGSTTTTAAATAIAASINGNMNVNGYVTASASGAVVTLTSRVAGTAGTFTLSTSLTTTQITGAAVATSPAASNGSATVTLSGVYESGDVVTVVINGTTVTYTATSTDLATDATGLESAITSAAISGISASASGAEVTITGSISSLTATATNGSVSAGSATVMTTANLNATGVSSNVSVAVNNDGTNVPGQTMTTATATLATPSRTTDSPAAQFVLGGSESTIVQYNFVATNGEVTLDKVTFSTTGNTIASVTVNGKTGIVVGDSVTISDIGYVIPAGYAGKTLPITVTYNSVGKSGDAAIVSGTASTLTLTAFEYLAGNARTPSGGVLVPSYSMNVVNAIPSVSITSTDRSGLTNGTVKLADVTISASASGGAIKLDKLPLIVTSTGVATASGITVKDSAGNTITTTDDILSVGAGASDGVVISFTGGYTIAAGDSKTFSIYTTADNVAGPVNTTSLGTALGAKTDFEFTDVNSATAITDGTPTFSYTSGVTSTIHN